MSKDNYKRMAKNAGMLYFRMLLTMFVGLYTSRVVLQTLGVDDYGIYNVVAGFVTMLGFLHSAMSSATQRFLSFELGKSEEEGRDVSGIFSMSLNIHIFIAILVLILGESIGLWFLNSQLNIPADRLGAAKWAFHLALLSFMVTIISVPYNALIIAHENMAVFAKVSIVDVFLKLAAVFMLTLFGFDKLILYAILNLLVAVIVFMIYRTYNVIKYEESRFKLYWDQQLFKTLISYTGWNLWGNIAAVMSNQGVNILLNIFFGPAVNAARGLAVQVSSQLNRFVQNLQAAINPQIVKSYVRNDLEYMHQLVCYSSKYNFYILLILAIPVLIHTDYILKLWLGIPPDNTALFIKLIICSLLIDSLSPSLMTAAQATGKIKRYQLVVGSILLLNVPTSYYFLNSGGDASIVFYVAIFLSLVALMVRVFLISKLINLNIKQYILEAITPVLIVSATMYLIFELFNIRPQHSFLRFSISTTILLITSIGVILILGLKNKEREFLFNTMLKIKKTVWKI